MNLKDDILTTLLSDNPFIIGKVNASFIDIKNKSEIYNLYLSKKSKDTNFVITRIDTPDELFSIFIACLFNNKTLIPIPSYSTDTELNNYLKQIPDNYLLIERPVKSSKKLELNYTYISNSPILGIFTSGSSGAPKVVLHSLESLYYSFLGTKEFYNIDSTDIWSLTLPTFHIAGMMILIRMFFARGKVYTGDDLIDNIITENKASILSLVPSQLQKLPKNIKSNFLKIILLGGQKIEEKLLNEYKYLPLSPTYGMSEFGGQVAASRNKDLNYEILNYRSIQEGSKTLQIKGPSMFLGYLKDKRFFPQNEVFTTNDLYKKNQNKINILGRSDSIFISGGENISPEEIESFIENKNPGSKSILVPVNDSQFSKVGALVTDLHKGDVKKALKSLHHFKRPKYILNFNDVNYIQSGIKLERNKIQNLVQDYLDKIKIDIIGNPNNQCLVFFHGFMGSSEQFTIFKDLLKDDFCLLFIDIPGHGKNKLYKFISREEIYKVILLKLSRFKKPILYGYSMGGHIALKLACEKPQNFNGIILESTSPGIKCDTIRKNRISSDSKLLSKISTQGDLNSFLSNWYEQPLFKGIKKKDQFSKIINNKKIEDVPYWSKSLKYLGAGARENLWDRIKNITCKKIILSGSEDEKYSSIAKEMQEHGFLHYKFDNESHNIHLASSKSVSKLLRANFSASTGKVE